MTWTIAAVFSGYLTLVVTLLTLWVRAGQKALGADMKTIQAQMLAMEARLGARSDAVGNQVDLAVARLKGADDVLDQRVSALEEQDRGQRRLLSPR